MERLSLPRARAGGVTKFQTSLFISPHVDKLILRHWAPEGLVHMDKTDVTVVVVPRDHFSSARASLESIFANTDTPFSLLYIDGGSPRHVARYLKDAAEKRQFRLIRTEGYLSPNYARNVAVRHVDTRYVVFVDNDVIVAPGWLDALVQCAERTGAAGVCPLTYEEKRNHELLHYAGGEAHIEIVEENNRVERHMIYGINTRKIAPTAHPTELLEFHCVLVRTDAYRAVGGMDERLLSTRDNLDFSLALLTAGYALHFEPASRVTFRIPARMALSDIPYFALRWSDEWDRTSFRYFLNKWNLVVDPQFAREFENLGWRRQGLMMRESLLSWLPARVQLPVERFLRPFERKLNRLISARYTRPAIAP